MTIVVANAPRTGLAALWGSYQAEGARDLRYDFLRGFAVLAMIVDHVGGPSWLYAVTGGNRFYTSAAEGFIFLSGLLVGVVYGRIVQRDGLAVGVRKALERAVVLYLLTVGVTFPLLLVSEMLDLPWATGVFLTDPMAIVIGVLTLHRTYYLIDVMVLYTLLLALAPGALYLLLQGQTRLLLGLSWGLWLAFQIAPDQAEVPWPIAGNYLFHFSAWQVFFFTAMALGYHRHRIARWFPPARQRLLLIISGLGFAGLLALYRLGDAPWQWLAGKNPALADPSDLLVLFFGKGDVRPGPVVASVVVFGFLFLFTTVAWRPLYRLLGWLLLPLGQNALYAYTAHIVIVVLLAMALQSLGQIDRQVRALNTALQVATILLIWLLVRYRIFFPSAEHRARWALVPATLGMVALVIMPLDPTPTQPGWEAPAVQAETTTRRAANAFGTPIPRGTGAPPPPAFTAAQPLPAPRHAASGRAASGTNVLPDYVGPIRGRFVDQVFYSRALDRDMSYLVYLPPDYDAAGRSYPVLYLLHGASGSAEEWPAYGVVDALDRAITAREVEPYLMVLPEGEWGYWINHADNGERWGDYLTRDLVTHVDTTYRTLRRPYRRAVGGLSMGGSGALVQAFNHPEVFGVVGAHSPSLREDNEVVPILGEGAEFAARDPLSLSRTAPGLDHVQIWLDAGEDDPWQPRVVQLHETLTAQGLEHEAHLWPGEHDGDYWMAHIPDYLRFYSYALTNR